ncbi:MAG: hypothetical protein ACI822_001629 [Gammaproteobacteria bacterium]|jgi:hypothetical protein
MRKALVAFQRRHKVLSWHEIDIDRSLDLIRKYDQLVPVLSFRDTEICHFFFDESAMIEILGLKQ